MPAGGGAEDPNPKSLVFACGFECGRFAGGSDDASHLGFTVAAVSISTSTVRSGSRSLRFNPAGQNPTLILQSMPAANMMVVRFYIRFATLPGSGNTLLFSCRSDAAQMGLYYKQSDGKLYTGIHGGTYGATGSGVIVTGQWYRIDMKFDQTDGARRVDAMVDGVALGHVADALSVGQSQLNYRGLENTFDAFGDWFYDDIIGSNTAADYPLGPGHVQAFVPVSDGAHNIAGSDDFERGNTGTDITNGTTDAYQLVDDVPMPAATPSDVDAIKIVAPANTTDYVELVMGPAGGGLAPDVGPRGVELIVAAHNGAAGTSNLTAEIADNGTAGAVATKSVTVTTGVVARGHNTNPPSAAGAWSTGSGDGNFNAVKVRLRSTDADPDLYIDSVMIEAEFSDV